jgi:hypothetical protein
MLPFEKSAKLKDEDFKQLIGVKRETFAEMVLVLTAALLEKHKKGGRPPKLTVENKLCLALKYWRQYLTQKEKSHNQNAISRKSQNKRNHLYRSRRG